MTESVLRSTADVTPIWLTGLLRVRGVLEKGHVVAVNVESSRPTLISHTATIRLAYSPTASLMFLAGSS